DLLGCRTEGLNVNLDQPTIAILAGIARALIASIRLYTDVLAPRWTRARLLQQVRALPRDLVLTQEQTRVLELGRALEQAWKLERTRERARAWGNGPARDRELEGALALAWTRVQTLERKHFRRCRSTGRFSGQLPPEYQDVMDELGDFEE